MLHWNRFQHISTHFNTFQHISTISTHFNTFLPKEVKAYSLPHIQILSGFIGPKTLSGKVNKTLSLQNQSIKKITDILCHECVLLRGIRLVTHIRMVAKSAYFFVMFLRLSRRLSKSNSAFTNMTEFRGF
jgi:hypothetical protein